MGELSQTVTAGKTGEVMVLLQAQSPRNIDSNIYFDEVTIQVGDRLLSKCGLDEDFLVEPSSAVYTETLHCRNADGHNNSYAHGNHPSAGDVNGQRPRYVDGNG